MKLKEMNEALQRLRDKYAVKADGEIVAAKEGSIGNAAELKFADGTVCKLLPWRKERRFIELKNLIDNKILEGVSTLRFMNLKAAACIRPLLYRELDLAAFLGEAEVASLFATVNGKRCRRRYEVDFVVNKGDMRFYIQSAWDIPDNEKRDQETFSLRHIGDNFRKVVVTGNPYEKPWTDKNGITFMGIVPFLLDPRSLETL